MYFYEHKEGKLEDFKLWLLISITIPITATQGCKLLQICAQADFFASHRLLCSQLWSSPLHSCQIYVIEYEWQQFNHLNNLLTFTLFFPSYFLSKILQAKGRFRQKWGYGKNIEVWTSNKNFQRKEENKNNLRFFGLLLLTGITEMFITIFFGEDNPNMTSY